MISILQGDCRQTLRSLPGRSVHCCVTSPPYFGLRDYGVDGQIGLEESPTAFIEAMVTTFREVHRVLRDDGTLWLNLGDSYASDGKWGGASGGINGMGRGTAPRRKVRTGLKPKDRLMIPARVAMALQDDGWWLRDEIIWHKPNAMPASLTDRTTPAHEMIYLLSKSARYHFDHKAIAEPSVKGDAGSAFHTGKTATHQQGRASDLERVDDGMRNKRSVWSVSTAPFKGAHFATFPTALIEPCVLAGCPKGGTVLDPFGGAGTTGLVADRLGRHAILCELNPDYAEITRRRIFDEAGLFAEIA